MINGKIKIFNILSLGGVLLVCLLFSCTQERQPCLTPKTASCYIEFVHFQNDTIKTPIDTALPYATFTAVTNNGLVGEVYTTATSIFTISLSPLTDTCTWLLKTDSTSLTNDTFQLAYSRQLQFLSNACGYTYFYTLNSFHSTYHNIDSVFITNPSVTNNANATKQLKIYIHPNF